MIEELLGIEFRGRQGLRDAVYDFWGVLSVAFPSARFVVSREFTSKYLAMMRIEIESIFSNNTVSSALLYIHKNAVFFDQFW